MGFRSHNPLTYDSSFTLSNINGVAVAIVDNLDGYLRLFELEESDPHTDEFIRYAVHE